MRARVRGGRALLLGFVTLWLTGAACWPTARIAPPPDAIQDPHRLLAALSQRLERLRSIRGEAKVDFFGREGWAPFSQVVVAERPGKLHIEALSPFDMPLAILTSDGERFQIYSLGEGTFYRGAATAANIGRFVPLPLIPEQLVELFLGSVPLMSEPRELSWDGEKGAYLLTLWSPEGRYRQELRVDPRRLMPLSSRLSEADGDLIYSIHFKDFEAVGGFQLPRVLEFEMPSEEIELSMSWKDREVNAAIPPEAYHQEAPRGARVEELGEGSS